VAWERPSDFRKVLSNVGSFVNIRGGYVYPERVLEGPKKPIRVFLCDGRNDNRRELRVGDENLHGQKFGGAILPEMMRWLWKDMVERAFNSPKASASAR
jgi:hypothetical protein